MKKLNLKKISETAKKIASWCNVRKRIDEHNYKLYSQAIDEAEHDFDILYHAVKGKIFDGEFLGDIASWYDEEKNRIIHKYGVNTEFIEHTTFRDIYNRDYLITQKARTGHCDGNIIQSNPDYEMYNEMIKEEIIAMAKDGDIEIGNIEDFEEDPNFPF